ncbi:periplasmic sensor signal transduction histidine kinase [Calothrix sp. NIES-4071]|nr:periplasmic sensor signal transduction histidine kinase [Calothrix sp. NIES-4071]BAZ55409.1 periplasmic sensor signal transduction histidine kinase [Calothrix sp. NIES-4105]
MNYVRKVFSKFDPSSLQIRLTVGLVAVSALGLASLATWTGWKMQQILIDSHKHSIKEIASRLPRDVELYSEMLPIEAALQKAIDNRTDSFTLLWAKNQENKILAKSNNLTVSSSSIADLIYLTQMPIKAQVYEVKGRYFVSCGEKLRAQGKLLGEISIARDITRDQTMFLTMLHYVNVASILVIIVISGVIAFYIKHSLQPLRQISQMTAVIEAENLVKSTSHLKLQLKSAPSEVKELAQTVNMMLSRLSQAWDKERQFTNNISHELRTPLTVVYGYLQSVLRRQHNLTEIQKEALETAASEAERTIRILQDLLDLARADDGYGQLNFEDCVLNDIVCEIAEMTSKNSSREIIIEAPHSIIVKADSSKLKQALLHLIDNAINYSNSDTSIIIKLKQTQKEGIIQVCDNGYGIPLQHQARIFERFYRVDEARGRSTGGTGLGLSVVKTFIEAMGGTVTVSSKIDVGSIFTIILPLS